MKIKFSALLIPAVLATEAYSSWNPLKWGSKASAQKQELFNPVTIQSTQAWSNTSSGFRNDAAMLLLKKSKDSFNEMSMLNRRFLGSNALETTRNLIETIKRATLDIVALRRLLENDLTLSNNETLKAQQAIDGWKAFTLLEIYNWTNSSGSGVSNNDKKSLYFACECLPGLNLSSIGDTQSKTRKIIDSILEFKTYHSGIIQSNNPLDSQWIIPKESIQGTVKFATEGEGYLTSAKTKMLEYYTRIPDAIASPGMSIHATATKPDPNASTFRNLTSSISEAVSLDLDERKADNQKQIENVLSDIVENHSLIVAGTDQLPVIREYEVAFQGLLLATEIAKSLSPANLSRRATELKETLSKIKNNSSFDTIGK